ncbi:MAG: cupin [Acidobacteria bacterium RIFCSPLOWO2_12_FULL_67_14]|nr:MAG: cupin [Acidobacteria bacterium RIFCSPLOWO2_12_FULL_67_14]
MSTKTQTATTHYHIQKKRRAEFLEEWRKYRHHVIRKEDVALVPTARGLRTGVYMGWDGDRPTRCLDALVHEIDPGTTTTIHRHSWDAILFMVEGSGWTDVDGVRYDWKPWDAFHIPAWSWHRHGNDGDRPGRFMSYSSEPTLWTLGMSLLEDAGHEPHASLPPRPAVSGGTPGNDPYARRLRRVAQETEKRRSGRIHTPYDEQEILATPRGTRTKFLNDRAIGNQASGLSQVMIQFAPGKTQSLHRHPGEAWLYVVEGHGHSFMGIAPDKGAHHRWKKGDLIVVDHFLWHQHFNDDPAHQCRLVRIHMFDSLLETMRAVTDPLVLFEDAEDTLISMQELSQIEWPDDTRPDS